MRGTEELAVQIAFFENIAVNQGQIADAQACQDFEHRAAQTAQADNADPGAEQKVLVRNGECSHVPDITLRNLGGVLGRDCR